ncbi:hypothetical protein V1478_017367 [Vespula squamosa]|uniref:Uncharacterized protein n=1 Tax=Vespula squamosa TaxID=30214 RepID=A0ABD1ZXT0_VESSQ
MILHIKELNQNIEIQNKIYYFYCSFHIFRNIRNKKENTCAESLQFFHKIPFKVEIARCRHSSLLKQTYSQPLDCFGGFTLQVCKSIYIECVNINNSHILSKTLHPEINKCLIEKYTHFTFFVELCTMSILPQDEEYSEVNASWDFDDGNVTCLVSTFRLIRTKKAMILVIEV